MMDMNPYQHQKPADSYKSIRFGAGIVLMAVGVLMVIFIFIQVYTLIRNPEKLVFYSRMLPVDSEGEGLMIGEERIILPRAVFHFLSYLVACLLFSIGAGIGASLIKAASSLIYPRTELLQAMFLKEKEKLGSRIRNLEEKIKQGS